MSLNSVAQILLLSSNIRHEETLAVYLGGTAASAGLLRDEEQLGGFSPPSPPS